MAEFEIPLSAEYDLTGMALPVRSDSDILALFPSYLKQSDSADVRNALVAAMRVMAEQYQSDASYSAAQSNVLRATGAYLDGLGEDRRVYRKTGENQTEYRERILSARKLVTPKAILEAVDTILSKYTPIRCQYFESVRDRMYVFSGSGEFGGGDSRSFVGAPPRYLDRLYPEYAAENEGFIRPQSSPGAARIYSHGFGKRTFVLRIPVLDTVSARGAVVFGGGESAAARGGTTRGSAMWMFRASLSSSATPIYQSTSTARTIYAAIIETVDRLRGQGIRWQMIVDPLLHS